MQLCRSRVYAEVWQCVNKHLSNTKGPENQHPLAGSSPTAQFQASPLCSAPGVRGHLISPRRQCPAHLEPSLWPKRRGSNLLTQLPFHTAESSPVPPRTPPPTHTPAASAGPNSDLGLLHSARLPSNSGFLFSLPQAGNCSEAEN